MLKSESISGDGLGTSDCSVGEFASRQNPYAKRSGSVTWTEVSKELGVAVQTIQGWVQTYLAPIALDYKDGNASALFLDKGKPLCLTASILWDLQYKFSAVDKAKKSKARKEWMAGEFWQVYETQIDAVAKALGWVVDAVEAVEAEVVDEVNGFISSALAVVDGGETPIELRIRELTEGQESILTPARLVSPVDYTKQKKLAALRGIQMADEVHSIEVDTFNRRLRQHHSVDAQAPVE